MAVLTLEDVENITGKTVNQFDLDIAIESVQDYLNSVGNSFYGHSRILLEAQDIVDYLKGTDTYELFTKTRPINTITSIEFAKPIENFNSDLINLDNIRINKNKGILINELYQWSSLYDLQNNSAGYDPDTFNDREIYKVSYNAGFSEGQIPKLLLRAIASLAVYYNSSLEVDLIDLATHKSQKIADLAITNFDKDAEMFVAIPNFIASMINTAIKGLV